MTYEFGRMRDIAQEIEDTAEFFARHFGNGLTFKGRFFGEGLVHLQQEIIDFIEIDPDYWEQKVRSYCYALEMQGKPAL